MHVIFCRFTYLSTALQPVAFNPSYHHHCCGYHSYCHPHDDMTTHYGLAVRPLQNERTVLGDATDIGLLRLALMHPGLGCRVWEEVDWRN